MKKSDCDSDYQIRLIKQYALNNGLGDPEIIADRRSWPRRNQKDVEMAKALGAERRENVRFFRGWEKMLVEAQNGSIGMIIVDKKERLYRNLEDKELLTSIIRKNEIRIMEANLVDWPDDPEAVNVAAYHFFVPGMNQTGIRTANLISDIGDFYEEIEEHDNWRMAGLYIDSWAYRRVEYPKLLERNDIQVIVCKFFYHISRKILRFLQTVRELNLKGTKLISTEEGEIHFNPATDWKKESRLKIRRIAVYNCFTSEYEKETSHITRKKLELFSRTLSLVTPEMEYYEETDVARRTGPEFERLASDARRYDLVLIDSFTKLGENVNDLMNCLRKVRIPFCSLKEGLLYIDGKIQSR